MVKQTPDIALPPGGILADEMGLGKTLEVSKSCSHDVTIACALDNLTNTAGACANTL